MPADVRGINIVQKITREMEAKLPAFINHKAARDYFKKIYGKYFVMVDVDEFDGEKIYFYHLILDEKKYKEGLEQFKKDGIVMGTDFLNSYQAIEISEDGSLHIIY